MLNFYELRESVHIKTVPIMEVLEGVSISSLWLNVWLFGAALVCCVEVVSPPSVDDYIIPVIIISHRIYLLQLCCSHHLFAGGYAERRSL